MKAYLIAFGLGLLAAGSAAGADLYVPQQAPQPAPVVSQASGWYLRGDIGYSFNDMKDSYYYNTGVLTPFDDTKLDDSFMIGAGAGYQVTKHFRVDFTGDYNFNADYQGITLPAPAACGATPGCQQVDGSKVTMLSLLANAYVDLGTWNGITPYVGAGIGGTHIKWDDFTPSGNCASCVSGPYGGHSDWRFTYAVMAGASVDLTCNLKLDASYRYRHINGGQTSAKIAGTNSPAFDDGVNVQDVRAGLRYTFGGCPAPEYASYEPAPVYK